MNKLKGTKTLQNLVNSFAGESQARNKYTMFASVAKNEGYAKIEQVFLETADNERLHAKEFYKRITDCLGTNNAEMLTVNGDYGFSMGDTYNNLLSAAAGEHEEFDVLYKDAAVIAEQEGFAEIALLFRNIAVVEEAHEKRYRALAEQVKNGLVFKCDTDVVWKCMKCGHIHSGKEAPKVCPICKHPQAYFEMQK